MWSLQSLERPKFIILTYIIQNLSSENSKRTEWSFLEITATLNTLDGLYQSIRILGGQKPRQNDLKYWSNCRESSLDNGWRGGTIIVLGTVMT